MRISTFYPHIEDAVKQTGLPLTEVLSKIKDYGIEGIECEVSTLRGDERAAIDGAGLKFASVYANYAFEREFDIDAVRRDVDDVVSCGCEKLLVIPGFIRKEQEDIRDELMLCILDGLKRVTEYAVSRGLIVSLEDYDNSIAPYSTIEGLEWFMERVPELGFTFDTGNFLYSEQSATEAFARLGDRLVHVHCKDRNLRKVEGETPLMSVNGCPIYTSPVGYGHVPMRECVRLVKKSGYNDWISVEHFGSNDQLAYIEKSAAWLRDEWEKE